MITYSISKTNANIGETITLSRSGNLSEINHTFWIIDFQPSDYGLALGTPTSNSKCLYNMGKVFMYHLELSATVTIEDSHTIAHTLTPITISVPTNQYINSLHNTPIYQLQGNSNITVDIGEPIGVNFNRNIYNQLKFLVRRWTKGKEDSSNKVTSLSENSTNTQYPSAKTVYDELMDTYTETLPSLQIVPSFTMNNVTKSVNSFTTGYDHFEKVVWDITFNDNTFQFFRNGTDETLIFFDGTDCYWGEWDGDTNGSVVKGNLICEGNEVQVILNKDKTITINGIDTTWRVIDNIEYFLFGNGSFSHTIYSHKYLDNDYLYYSTTIMSDINDTWEDTINSITKEHNEVSSSFINNRPYWTTQGHFTITFNDNDFSYCHLGSSVDIYFDGTDCYWGEWDENNDNVMNKGSLICTGNVLYVYFGINPRSVYFPNGETNYLNKSMAYFGDVEIKATYEVSRFELIFYKTNYISSNDSDTDGVEYPNNYAIKQYAEKKSNKTSSWNSTTDNTRYPTEKLVKDSLDEKENISNKVTSISSSSTDTQYPSAKAVYDFKQSVEIQENDDLDDYTEVGMYYSPTGTVSSTLSNCPVTNAFALFVEKGSSYENACTQTITTWNGTQVRKFIRYSQIYGGTFESSGWQTLYEDTGWKNLSFSSGYGNYDSSHPVRYRRIGKIVHIEGIFKNTNAIASGSSVQIGTIADTSCRPTYEQYSLQQGSSKNFFLLKIGPSGNVNLERYGTTANAQTTAGAWLHCNMTWFVD